MNLKLFLGACSCVLLVMLSACKPSELNQLTEAASALKTVFAQETAHLAGANKKVVIIASNATQGPSVTMVGDFKSALEKEGLSVVETTLVNLGDPMQYNAFGLKSADFLEVLRKHSDAGAIVSLVGSPHFHVDELGKAASPHPPVLVVAARQIGLASGVATNPALLETMLNAKIIQLAVIDGTDSSGKTDKAHKTFDQQFRILRSNP